MNDTRSINEMIQGRPWSHDREHRPRFMTFVAQAAVGSMFAYFILFVVPFAASVTERDITQWASMLIPLAAFTFFLVLGLGVGVLPGVIIWACTRSQAEPLHRILRCAIAAIILLPGWAYVALLIYGERPRAVQQLWLVGWLVLPAIMIGLLTHSRLRLGQELVRRGEEVKPVSRVLAGLTGVVLRITVGLLFMESVVTVIGLNASRILRQELVWATLMCGHFTASLLVVFLRSDFRFVTAVAAIALVPLVIALITLPESAEVARYILYGYLALWAMFLLSRWRQTDVALSFLNEEIRYYLID